MKFSVSLFATIFSLAAYVNAQGAEDPNCFTACAPVSKITAKCGYDLTSNTQPSSAQQLCMCKAKGFVDEYQSCQSCSNKIGNLSDADYKNAQAVCDGMTGNSASSARPINILAVLVAVGVGLGGTV